MSNNIWQKLDRPIYALAPMAGVADSAFRQICSIQGADLFYSEMASATALCFSPEKTLSLLRFTKKERPYIVQLFGSEPKHFGIAAKIVAEKIQPDGVDVNFGCPVPKVVKQKAGAELFKDKKKSREVLLALLEATDLPISIKTRTKVGAVHLFDFLKNIQDLDIKAIMIHGRSLRQGFSGQIDYGCIRGARNYFTGTILANGGVVDKESAKQTLSRTKADGLGIARGAFGRPWIFSELKKKNVGIINNKEMKKLIIKHAKLLVADKGKEKLVELRKHLVRYFKGRPESKNLRIKLSQIKSIKEIKQVLKEY